MAREHTRAGLACRRGGGVGVARFSRRGLLIGAGASLAGAVLAACAPKPTLDAARHTLRGLWDAAVPGTHAGRVQDRGPDGTAMPGAVQANVQEWFEAVAGTLPPPLDYVTDWFLRAWAADLDLWADTFHLPIDGGPSFGDLPLGPTLAQRGRQYKVMLMMKLFPGPIELKYVLGMMVAKMAFYGDFHAELTGAQRVGGPYIGFRGPTGTTPIDDFTYGRTFGTPDARLVSTTRGLVNAP